jgi:hypothetical protein
VVPAALAKLPADLPVLLIGSPPSYWNQQGAVADALVAARTGRFVGVILDGGSHADYVQGGNPVMQFIENVLVGFPQPRNIEAAQILAAGWINDMFAGTHDGNCSAPGEVFPVHTSAGTATAYALPGTPQQVSPLQALLTALANLFTVGLAGDGSAASAAAPAPQTSS